jgi:hypothetical protein
MFGSETREHHLGVTLNNVGVLLDTAWVGAIQAGWERALLHTESSPAHPCPQQTKTLPRVGEARVSPVLSSPRPSAASRSLMSITLVEIISSSLKSDGKAC